MQESRAKKQDLLVSIIIPVYNKVAYLRETLDSALRQTYENIEIVLVDDGSSDGSFEILKEYFEKYPERIILIDQENQGVSVATNVGIQAAKGEYIQFLDADDLLSSDKIENQIRLLEGKPTFFMASCEWVMFQENPNSYTKIPYGVFQSFDKGIDLLLKFWSHQEMMAVSSFLTHKSLVEKAGAWNESLKINQDGEFFCRILTHCDGILFEPNGKVFYRRPTETNVSQQKSEMAFQSLLDSYKCYEMEVLRIHDSKHVRIALKKVYQKFIYDAFPKYPELIKEAQSKIKSLGVKESTYIGGPKFRTISKLIGFNFALRLKKFMQ
jgi:glycosyltransferase involved in cell wall biosynthesis